MYCNLTLHDLSQGLHLSEGFECKSNIQEIRRRRWIFHDSVCNMFVFIGLAFVGRYPRPMNSLLVARYMLVWLCNMWLFGGLSSRLFGAYITVLLIFSLMHIRWRYEDTVRHKIFDECLLLANLSTYTYTFNSNAFVNKVSLHFHWLNFDQTPTKLFCTAKFGGLVTLKLMLAGKHFINEQPFCEIWTCTSSSQSKWRCRWLRLSLISVTNAEHFEEMLSF